MYIVYKTINLINNRYYYGVHKCTLEEKDNYLGSGRAIKRAVRKYGSENFKRETICVFNDAVQAYEYEKQIVELYINDPLCYNLMSGGKGGFDHINNDPARINPMKIDLYKERQKQSARDRLQNDKNWAQRKRQISVENAKKASQANLGRKRPGHSCIMKEKSSLVQLYKEDKEKYRDMLASTFEVKDINGHTFVTNRLEDFCKEHNLGYVSLWNTSRTNKTVTKGKSKGWICKKI